MSRNNQRYIYQDNKGNRKIVRVPYGWWYVMLFGNKVLVEELEKQTKDILVAGLSTVSKYTQETLEKKSLTALWKISDYIKEGKYLN